MILDGKKVRDTILDNVKKEIEENNLKLKLAIILVGNNSASEVYIRNKVNSCEKVGIASEVIRLSENVTEDDIIGVIEKLNKDNNITGIILQSPIPNGLDIEKCIKYINHLKDVDGFTKENFYSLVHDIEGLRPCTAHGIIRMLEYYGIEISGKNVCIIGRGSIVGKPLLFEFLNKDATVSICHSKTKNIMDYTKNADIIVSAAGKHNLITADMVNENAVVIDVGISVIDGKITGDVDFENVSKKCAYISPTPGGVGPVTVAIIIENVLNAYKGGKCG